MVSQAKVEVASDAESGSVLSGLPLDFRTFDISIVEGAHRGVGLSLQLDDGLTIGSDPGDDIILFADDLEPGHASLALKNRLFGTIRVEAVNGPVDLGDRGRIEPGQWVDMEAPLTITLGGAVIEVRPGVDFRAWLKKIVAGFLVVGGLYVLYRIAVLFLSSAVVGIGMLGDAVSPADAPRDGATISQDRKADARPFVDALRKRLADAGLGGKIRIDSSRPDVISLSGKVAGREVTLWREILKWYDTNIDAPVLLNNVRKGPGHRLAVPEIASIWAGDKPLVVLKNGRTATTGDLIGDGWLIERIEPGIVTISRDGRQVNITN